TLRMASAVPSNVLLTSCFFSCTSAPTASCPLSLHDALPIWAEENIELFLNTDITEVDADDGPDGREIRAVTGWMSGSERRLRFAADAFIDCSGDGLVGHLAGAESRRGSEPRAEFDESWAPEHPGEDMLGSTILFYTKDVGH